MFINSLDRRDFGQTSGASDQRDGPITDGHSNAAWLERDGNRDRGESSRDPLAALFRQVMRYLPEEEEPWAVFMRRVKPQLTAPLRRVD